MRTTFILVAFLSAMTSAISCKSRKATASSAAVATSSSSSTPGVSGGSVVITSSETTNTTASGENQGAYVGKVSHKYRSTGCATVIIFSDADGSEVIIIPKDKLNADIDVDGQTIKFDYRPLKMPQPEGCTAGMPAEVSNITKLK